MRFYDTDLAFVHDAAFGDYARGMAPEIVRLFARHGIRRALVVELGCGSGITAAHLVARGYDVYGVDASPAMIRLARSRAPKARFAVGEASRARLPRCASVIAIGEVVTYSRGRSHGPKRLTRLFRRVHDALPPGGLFVFDFMESARGRTYHGKSHAGPGWDMTVSATCDSTGRWLTRRITLSRRVAGTLRRTRETHRVRLFARDEIRRALAAAGLDVRFQRSLGRVRLMKGDVLAIARRPR